MPLAAGPAAPASVADKQYILHYDKPAPLDLKGWEFYSLPLGNGYFGVSVFGGVADELWQFTDKSLWVMAPKGISGKDYPRPGLSNLCELRLAFQPPAGAAEPRNYQRDLNLNEAVASVSYEQAGVTFRRELLTSFPEKCFAARLTASKPGQISFSLKALHAYLCEFRTGQVRVEGNRLIMTGATEPYKLNYEVHIQIETEGGVVRAAASGESGEIFVEGADEAVVYVTLGSNYRLESQVFSASVSASKLGGFKVTSERLAADLQTAVRLGWNQVRASHLADYQGLFGRVRLDLGGKVAASTTDVLLAAADKPAADARYLEELYFQFGRYLLIASSRAGTLPANLQGTWNMQQCAPWTGGYWANINIQMNYWPAFVTNLEETFSPYYDYFKAAFPAQQVIAANALKKRNLNKFPEAGWTAGTGNSAYRVVGPGGTSGDGTGPFVNLLLWDWYAFTGDKTVLEKAWPFFLEGSRYLAQAVQEQPDGTLLCSPSYSPEQMTKGPDGKNIYIEKPGAAYDQQLVVENYRMTLKAAQILGKQDPLLAVLSEQLPKLSPVLIGASGQIKEFRQENAFGEIGDPRHRHISQLIGLYPGTVISDRPEWIEAARVSLDKRGDKSTGWAMAHRLNAWARVKDGDRAHTLLTTLLAKGTMPNLWDTHPPFQIDGNFGGTSGIAEMLLQSHTDVIELLPALPAAWPTGSVVGLRARGGFTVDIAWANGRVTSYRLSSAEPREVAVRVNGVTSTVRAEKGGQTTVVSPAATASTAKTATR
jgi:alpha-L-fucosidase 2